MKKYKVEKTNSKLMDNVKRKTSGITLIALVVTIVVLLILASISIGLLTGEDGIISQAKNAKEETEISEEKEKVEISAVSAAGNDKWGTITEENLADELTKNIGTRDEDYTLSKEGESFLVTYTDSNRSYVVDANGNIIEAVKREGLEVGDYINYIPDANTEGYTADKLTEAITGDTRNTSTITQDSQYAEDGTGMTWQILRIYADGSIDLIGSETSQTVYFRGVNGYNNGVTVMNDICETLYSRGDIKARSVNCEDIEYWLTDEGRTARDSYISYDGNVKYGQTKTYTQNIYYPNLYKDEIGAGIDVETVNTTGLETSDKGTAIGSTQATIMLTVTQTCWYGDMNETNFGEGYNVLKANGFYWIASRYVSCESGYANFGLRYVRSFCTDGVYMFNSKGQMSSDSVMYLRPVVSLPSSVQIEACTGTNGKNNMHKITQY